VNMVASFLLIIGKVNIFLVNIIYRLHP
jgi:hypothetical protein